MHHGFEAASSAVARRDNLPHAAINDFVERTHMKLASLKGGRDGRLVVVSDDLAWFAYAGHIATTLQDVLDNWDLLAPKLELLATDLNHGVIPRERFHERDAAAPLPRAYQYLGSAAYLSDAAPDRHDPLIAQRGSDGFLGPRDPIPLADVTWECNLGAGIVIVTGDVPIGTPAAAAGSHIRLVGFVNEVTVYNLIPTELAQGSGLFQSNLASAFSPVFVTPESLGKRWDGGKLHGALSVDLNSKALGRADAGVDMAFDFGQLIAHATKTRALSAGTIISSGPVSRRGEAGGPFLARGDTVRIWMEDDKRHPIFGVIEQMVG
jgi:fumarylacetoacetate (FAA) hydrolase